MAPNKFQAFSRNCFFFLLIFPFNFPQRENKQSASHPKQIKEYLNIKKWSEHNILKHTLKLRSKRAAKQSHSSADIRTARSKTVFLGRQQLYAITKTRLFKHIENFTTKK